MFAQERQNQILAILSDQGSVRVADLAQKLSVTEETVRRDLERLGNDGKLIRIHGGALAVEDNRRELPFDIRKSANLKEKTAIATEAARHVVEGDVVALDASSTAFELARALPDISITVVTYALPVVTALTDRTRIRTICTGGALDVPSMSFYGPITERSLERFNVTKLFLSSKGVDLERGLSETSETQSDVKRRMIDLADQTYLLVDHSKLDVRSTVFFAATTSINTLITDRGADAAFIHRLQNIGPEVILVDA